MFACIYARVLAFLHVINSSVFVQKGRGPGGLYRTAVNMYGQSITSASLFCGLFSNGDIANAKQSPRNDA